jgi:DNA-binding transcriptional regulator YhcF (GntR family)
VLAEGDTEQRLFPLLFEKIVKQTLEQKNIAFIKLGGVGSTAKCMKILDVMGLPTKAIVDLDYILKYAKQHDIDNNANSFTTVNEKFKELEREGKVTLRNGGFPQKSNPNPFTILARETDTKNAIEEIHNLFKSKNIWVWKKGDIEEVLNLSDKEIETHFRFISDIKEKDIGHCEFHAELKELVDWLTEF